MSANDMRLEIKSILDQLSDEHLELFCRLFELTVRLDKLMD